jgi:hypothetical protein
LWCDVSLRVTNTLELNTYVCGTEGLFVLLCIAFCGRL